MSLDLIEASAHDGDIVELFRFTFGENVWYMTSNAREYIKDGIRYKPYAINSSQVERTGQMNRTSVSVEVDYTNPIAQLFLIEAPRNIVGITIIKGNRNDEFAQEFAGRVLDCKWSPKRKASLICEPTVTSMRRQALRDRFSSRCGYIVYSAKCGAEKVIINGKISAISGLKITVPEAGAYGSKMLGGIVTLGLESRTITKIVGDDLTLTSRFSGASIGDDVTFSIGCDQSTNACRLWHDNVINFGGEPYTPDKNIFLGKIT